MELTPAEQLESIAAMADIGISTLAIYISVISGYLVVAFLIGKRLTKSQLTIVTSLFVVFGLILSFGSFIFFQNVALINGEGDWRNNLPLALFVIQVIGMVAAIKFMLDMRKEDKQP